LAGIQLETKLEPVGVKDHLTSQGSEDDQQDKTATTAGAGCTPAETKGVLKPVKEHVQHQEFE
jgi:hypothetical protein